MLVHGRNLSQKENHGSKYLDELSRQYLSEIRSKYDKWHDENVQLSGPWIEAASLDRDTVRRRVELLEGYKEFVDQQEYAENFDSRSNLHSSVLEEFLHYLFRDLVSGFGKNVLFGKSQAFKDLFFVPPRFAQMTQRAHARIETKDHDFVIGNRIEARLELRSTDTEPETDSLLEFGSIDHAYNHKIFVGGNVETHVFDIPAIVIECKTYLDKTMLEGSSRAAEQLKATNPNALYIVVMEWLKLTSSVNLKKYELDQIYVFRRQKNTDREFRFLPSYEKNPIDPDVVWHLYELVRNHLITDWENTIEQGLERGWLL